MSTPTLAGVSAGRFRRIQRGRNHSYQLDGERLLGVTTILSLGIPKPALISWAAGQAAQYAWDHWDELAKEPYSDRIRAIATAHDKTRNRAAVKGTTIHGFGERLAHGEKVEGIPEEVASKVDQYVAFLNEWQVVPVVTEAAICNMDVRYGGTLDLIFTSPLFPGRVFLGDIKTGKDVYGDMALQLEAYGRADFYLDGGGGEVPMVGLGITDHVIIHLEDERYSVFEMIRGDEVWDVFQHAVGVARAMDGPRRGDSQLDSFVGGEMFKPGEAWL